MGQHLLEHLAPWLQEETWAATVHSGFAFSSPGLPDRSLPTPLSLL